MKFTVPAILFYFYFLLHFHTTVPTVAWCTADSNATKVRHQSLIEALFVSVMFEELKELQ